MSIKLLLDDLSEDQKKNITDKLQFQKKETQYNKMNVLPKIRPYDIVDLSGSAYIFLPFYWANKNITQSKRPERDQYPPNETTFKGSLRKLQKEVKSDALKLLGRNGTCLLSFYTGVLYICHLFNDLSNSANLLAVCLLFFMLSLGQG